MNSGDPSALLKIARDRLHPSLTDPNFLVLNARRKIFANWINTFPASKMTILDVGGRYQPYRPLFESRISKYLALDILQTNLVDVVGSGEALPFANNSFDLVIATQVFEYFSSPRLAADQIHTVLKPGGMLLMSVAAFAPRFSDDDRWRFTPAGIRTVLGSFGKVEIIPEVSSLGGFIRSVNVGLNIFVRYDFLRSLLSATVRPLANLIGLGFERINGTKNDQFTPNYSVLAIK